MGKLNFILTNFIFWPVICLTACLLSSFEVSQGSFFDGYDNLGFYGLAFVIFALIIVYFVIEHKINKFKVHPVYFPIYFFLLITSVVTIWIQGTENFVNEATGYAISITIQPEQKLKFSIVIALFLTAIYMMIFMFSRKQFRAKQTYWFMWLYVLFVVVIITLSIILEGESIKEIFEKPNPHVSGLKSIFHNANVFALYILYGLLALMVLNYYKTRFYNYILMAGFYIYMLFTTCSATFFVGTFAFTFYIVFDLIRHFKKHWKSTLIFSCFTILFLVGLVIACSILYSKKVDWFINITTYIDKEILSKDFGTFTGRTTIWKYIWNDLVNTNPVNLLLGRGYGTSNIFLKAYGMMRNGGDMKTAIISSHNGLVGVLLRSGLIGVSLYLILILFAAGTAIYLIIKKRASFAITFGLVIVSVLVHSMFENTGFYGPTMTDVAITIMFMTPFWACARTVRHPKLESKIKEADYCRIPMQHRKLRRFVSIVILGLMTPCVSLLTSQFTYNTKDMPQLLIFILVLLAISFVFVPQIITMFYKNATRRRFIFRMIFYPLLFAAILPGVLSLVVLTKWKINFDAFIYLIFASYCLVLVVIFSIVKKDKLSHYLSDVFFHSFSLVKFTLPISLVVGAASNFILDQIFTPTILSVVDLNTTPLILYFVLFTVIPSKEKYYYTNYFNEAALYKLKRTTLKYEI